MTEAGRPRLRVEMVLPTLEVAGMEHVVAQLSTALYDRGHSVGITCVNSEGAMAPDLRASGIRVAHIPADGRRSYLWPVGLRRWFQTITPDVVQIHNEPWLKAALAARQARVPLVLFTLHGRTHENWVDHALDRRAAKLSDRVTTVSTALRDHVVEHMRVDPERVLAIPNGVDVERFAPGPAPSCLRASLGLRADQPLIGMIARLEPVKNHACLLRAFVKVIAEHPTARLILVGDGQLRREIEERIVENGLSEHVLMTGVRSDVPDVYRALDVCVLPSLAEGASISILEAMASGVCIVASKVGGTPELLDNGACGLLVPSNDPGALAQGICKVLADSELRRTLGAAARGRCVERFSFAEVVGRYEQIYRSDCCS